MTTRHPGLGFALTGLALAGLLLGADCGVRAEDEDKRSPSGSVELVYRDVDRDGSRRKYDEDFDGLDSGVRLANLELDWSDLDSKLLDHARLELSGLGDPYRRGSFQLGRRNVYDLRATHWQQAYLYDLFGLVNNEDGAAWDARRRMTDLTFRAFPSERVQLSFNYQRGERTGNSLFMKDVERNLFRLDTPLDAEHELFSVAATVEVGPVNLLFRQSRRSYDNRFRNITEDNAGLEAGALSRLDSYDWLQRDDGDVDLTTIRVGAGLGKRVRLAVSLIGTLLGEEQLDSRVGLDATGLDFNGDPFSVVGGSSRSEAEGDTMLVDVDLTVKLVEAVDLHLQFRNLDRELDGVLTRDLDGDGLEDDIDGDGVPSSDTRLDYELSTLTALVEARPARTVALRAGYRTIDRTLDRNGFGGLLRDTELDSDDDETVIFGLSLRPVKWFRLNADIENGDITQPFNAVAPRETSHTRIRAAFLPQPEMRIDLGYLDFDHDNNAPDLRSPGSFYDGTAEGTTHSVAFWHKANENVDYMLRYAEQEIDTRVGVRFDLAGFNLADDGDSVFQNDNTQLSAYLNYRWSEAWKIHARYTMTESEGHNLLFGDASGLVNDEVIAQDYDDWELGLTYLLPNGLYFGADYRDFEYDDGGHRLDGLGAVLFSNDGLDYKGQIVSLRAGLTF